MLPLITYSYRCSIFVNIHGEHRGKIIVLLFFFHYGVSLGYKSTPKYMGSGGAVDFHFTYRGVLFGGGNKSKNINNRARS